MVRMIVIFILFCASEIILGQQVQHNIHSKDSLYSENIKKSRLYDVYIPRDLDDALIKLMELTNEEARMPLLKIDEQTMAKKLYFGLGRWMEYNWNFAEGSRFSHYLRQKGLTYTEDMTRFMLIAFHRHLTEKPLNMDDLIKKLTEERKNKIKEENEKLPVVRTQKKIIPKN
jgi:hypothetical protein